MYLITLMQWSDAAMGDGNPQTQVALRENIEEAHQYVVDLVNDQYNPEDEDGKEFKVKTFDEAVEFLKTAPETPELDISEITVGGDQVFLSRDVLDDHPRLFNGKREI